MDFKKLVVEKENGLGGVIMDFPRPYLKVYEDGEYRGTLT